MYFRHREITVSHRWRYSKTTYYYDLKWYDNSLFRHPDDSVFVEFAHECGTGVMYFFKTFQSIKNLQRISWRLSNITLPMFCLLDIWNGLFGFDKVDVWKPFSKLIELLECMLKGFCCYISNYLFSPMGSPYVCRTTHFKRSGWAMNFCCESRTVVSPGVYEASNQCIITIPLL